MSASAVSSIFRSARLCAIAGALSIAALVSGCASGPGEAVKPAKPVVEQNTGPVTVPSHLLTSDQPGFLRLPNMAPGRTPVRVGILLPFSNASAQTRALAQAMMKAAQLSLFDAHNSDIVLIAGDEGSSAQTAANSARQLLDQGAEIIIGPLFSQSVSAIAPIARDRGVPVIGFSTDRGVGGDGVYLLSFQPENEVKRIIGYAAAHGSANFAALIPQNAYGNHIAGAFEENVTADGGKVVAVQRFNPAGDDAAAASASIAAQHPDAILVADGGNALKVILPALDANGVDRARTKLLGTGLWNDSSASRDAALQGAWFPAPAPFADDSFNAKFKETFGTNPPQLASLSYDAIALVALLASGQPYHRFTREAITDPNGFAGINGIFRFRPDGGSERGLSVLGVNVDGATIVDRAPTTFQPQGS